MSTAKEEAGPSKSWDSTTGEPEVDNRTFECNICLDTAKDAVISMCGHLFCWPCLHQWLETRPLKRVCPVCKATISKDKVIPLYGRGDTRHEDPRNNVPPRPTGQRTEPESNVGFSSFGFGDNSFMSFGIGTFPFAFLTSTFNFGETRPSAEAPCICLGKLPGVTSFARTDYICDLYKNGGDLRACSCVAPTGTSHYEEEQFLSKVFLWVALVFICWLLMA